MKKLVTFGEVMGRFEAPPYRRLVQAMPGTLQVTFAGAEANVAATNAILGAPSTFVSVIPRNPLGDACVHSLQAVGISTERIYRAGDRLGLYFVETGINQRPSRVVYDRDHTGISEFEPDDYDWDSIFQDADWFHVSGITPALSEKSAEATRIACQRARDHDLTVSFDLNYRAKLWNWDPSRGRRQLAQDTMATLLPYVDVLIGNEADAEDTLSIRAGNTAVEQGQLEIDRYPGVASQIISKYPNVRYVAITLRESCSASHNRWGAMLYVRDNESAYFAPRAAGKYQPYDIRNVVDRIGAGDSFAGALIFALRDSELKSNHESAVGFAAAASALCHSIQGDFNYSSREEIEALLSGETSGRVKR